MEEVSDQQLIVDYLVGNEDSFAVLLHRHLALVVNFANSFVKNRQTAEDLAQVTFIKVWQNLKKFKLESNFKSWVLIIARNTCLDYLRKHRKDLANVMLFDGLTVDDQVEIEDSGDLPDEILFKQEQEEMLNAVLTGFTEADKLIVSLHYYEQLTFEEIAEVLNQSVNTVKSRHRRLLIKLREKIA